MIPKIVMQTSLRRPPESVIRRNKRILGHEFEYVHYDDEAILKFFHSHPIGELPNVSKRFEQLKSGEHKADLFRYYYLYLCGGVYFDSDVLLVANLSLYTSGKDFVSVLAGNVGSALFQGFLAASPRHPVLLKAVLDVCEISNQQLASDHHVLCKNLKRFLDEHLESNSSARASTLLFSEVTHSRSVAKSVDEYGDTVLYHFWKRRYPPRFPISVPGAKWAF